MDEKTIHIALTYGKTVNRGVIEMEKRLREGNQEVTKENVYSNPEVTYEDYWNHLEALLKKWTNPARPETPPLKLTNQFSTGSQLKKIGNITPEEELPEPVGRQGREIR